MDIWVTTSVNNKEAKHIMVALREGINKASDVKYTTMQAIITADKHIIIICIVIIALLDMPNKRQYIIIVYTRPANGIAQ